MALFGWVCGDYVKYAKSEISADGVPLYGQGDPQWGGDYVGSSGKTIGEIGCAMTSSTMVLNKISGKSFTPKEMNNYLNNHGGYGPGGGIIWWQAGQYDNMGKNAESTDLNIEMIDTCLESGRPVVVRVLKPKHYVCVAGRKSDGSYIIHDSSGNGTNNGTKKSAVWDGSAFKVEGYDPATTLFYFY
ncbi:MAG: C39 family peptidase [Proteobacteria bacterium]|nr:C39 family peptidase [Pseudomonadota bacterium]